MTLGDSRHWVEDTPEPHAHIGDSLCRQALETCRTRLLITATVVTLAFGVVGLRLVDVAAFNQPAVERPAAVRGEQRQFTRSDIVDRNGALLATSLATVSLSADPARILDPVEAATKLAKVFPDKSSLDLQAQLTRETRFVWIHRSLTPHQQWAVNRLGIPGLEFHRTEKRVYPHQALLAHVLGFTDVDNNGLAGVERTFDERLRGSDRPLALSVDIRVQHILREALAEAMREYRAVGAAGIVMDAKTGEVIAMSSLPDFDPNHPGEADADTRFNRATLGVYELGSTFKIFNTAMALDTGAVTLDHGYDATKPIRVGRFTISDYQAKNRWLSVPEIFIYSSNIGSAKMALDIGTEEQRRFFTALGFTDALALELPEVGRPQTPSQWRPVNTMTIAFGHGMAVSPMHMAAGVAAMLNGGVMHQPTLVADAGPRMGRRVISEDTSRAMRALMYLNSLEGSGRRATVEGYLVGGKTGTAEKVGARDGYNRKALISSFVGAFPMQDPRFIVYAVLDEPKGTKATHGFATGGWVAAPVVKDVVRRAAPVLGVTPVDAESPGVRQQLAIERPQETKRLASF